MTDVSKAQLLQAVATASAGYFAANPMPNDQIEPVLKLFFKALASASGAKLLVVERVPAVPVDKSVAADFVTCLECGKTLKSLKGHLRVTHHLNPDEYRLKWGLPDDHPIIAPASSQLRSSISKSVQDKISREGVRRGGRRKKQPV